MRFQLNSDFSHTFLNGQLTCRTIRKNNRPRNILVGVAQEFGLGKSTISGLWRDRKNIEKFSAESGDTIGLKKRCLSGENDKDFIVPCILVSSGEKKNNSRNTFKWPPFVMDKAEILFA